MNKSLTIFVIFKRLFLVYSTAYYCVLLEQLIERQAPFSVIKGGAGCIWDFTW